MEARIKPKKALISATNKDLIKDFAIDLNSFGVEIYSTKGTSAFLKNLGINAKSIEEYTGFPEILDGRVKTLHPKIFGGILSKRTEAHKKQTQEFGIAEFDVVCVDLYAFKEAVASGANLDNAVEHIDIGGISLIRASAKAFKDVTILVDPKDFDLVLGEIKQGGVTFETRKKLAFKAFQHSSSYDEAIYSYLGGGEFSLRYGENPHQKATFIGADSYIEKVLKGEVSYNNLLDLDGSAELCFGLKNMGYKYVAVIVKHGSPCGIGVSEKSTQDAFIKAWDCDETSSYGGVLVLSTAPENEILESMKGKFVEVLCAPDFSESFLSASESRKKLKIVKVNKDAVLRPVTTKRSACCGILEQEKDLWWNDFSSTTSTNTHESIFKTVSKREPSKDETLAIRLGWAVAAGTKSNSIIITSPNRVLGIGGGCVSRIDATNMAVTKARAIIAETGDKGPYVLSSDGFLPFADSVVSAKELGVTAIVEPGGSIRDEEVVESCNNSNVALVFTGKRHFRH